jgi:hypothetical protein
VKLIPLSPIEIQVWDRDLAFDDLIGEAKLALPASPPDPDGRWTVGPFGQVRKLVLRLA